MARYHISGKALADIDHLYAHEDFTCRLTQIDVYFEWLVIGLQDIADQPERYRDIDHVPHGYSEVYMDLTRSTIALTNMRSSLSEYWNNKISTNRFESIFALSMTKQFALKHG